MLKRIILLSLSACLVFGLFGCAGNGSEEPTGAVEPIEDIYPEMEYGVWETDVLKSEPGNYDRSARVSNGSWAETTTGYYVLSDEILYYADKTNPGNQVPLCSNPDCGHGAQPGSTCSAYVHGGVCFANDRIYFLADAKYRRSLYSGNKSGYILCSMAMDGSDQKAEYIWEDAMLSSAGTYSASLCQTGCAMGIQQLQPNGLRRNQLFFADKNGARCVSSWTETDLDASRFVIFPKVFTHLSGKLPMQTNLVDFDGNFYSTFCWIEDECLQVADLAGLPYHYAYFYDGNLRFFRANDGYYDVDLITMEEVKLCGAQLENSGVRFLQANCILESNLIEQNSNTPDGEGFSLPRVGEGVLRLFNGQQWLDVELPEEVKNLPEDKNLYVTTLTGEYIICTARIDGVQRYYRIDLAAENLKLEYWFEMNT